MNTLAHNYGHEKMNPNLVGIARVATSSRPGRQIERNMWPKHSRAFLAMAMEQGSRPRSMPAPSPYVFK